jgi:ParB-like nuclease domain
VVSGLSPHVKKSSKRLQKKISKQRAYQQDLESLKAEWNTIPEQFHLRAKEYHARRIAYFVVNGWTDPIVLEQDARTIVDGLHRLKAAIYLGNETVEATIKSASHSQ